MNVKLRPMLLVLVPLLVLAAAWASRSGQDAAFDADREGIALRKIAHEVLRQAGDSHSRIPPVIRQADNEFLLRFENAFSFTPDSLVRVIDRTVHASGLPVEYVVTVHERESGPVVFGYAMTGSGSDNIVPCLGREQPLRRYDIGIRFRSQPARWPWLSGLALLILGGTYFLRKRRKQGSMDQPLPRSSDEEPALPMPRIGQYLFDAEEAVLLTETEKIPLTAKETKLLSIFVATPNVLIDRARLQKEVWEDEGVIVGRSLDMFVSRLRKKLEKDHSVRLLNIHGRGYKLETGAGGADSAS